MRLRVHHAFFAFLATLLTPCCFAQDSFGLNTGRNAPLVRSSVLPVDEAFALTTFIEAPDTAVLLWEIREGYYLYRKSIRVTDGSGNEITIGTLPEGENMTDEFFGEVNVYRERLLVRFPLDALPGDNDAARFALYYQGCAEDLYCYPEEEREVELELQTL